MAETYTVLARRYRSQTFDELVGQEAVAQTLKNAITSGRVAHAFMFTGTRGVGKTSSARILAKALNCPNLNAGNPCGVCDTCKAIARGEDMDVIEIDGASNNGVDQVRELRQAAGIRPARSPYKIYIIDEVHMLSTGAFNALLKTLEEPPSHVKFIFATTDIHKVPATIISRCQRFDFKNIPTPRIAEHLRAICKDESVQADEDALYRIARLGNGSMRDALSLLDRVLSLGDKHITDKLLEDLLGKPPTAAIAELVTALAAHDAAETLRKTDGLLSSGMGPEQVLSELIEFLRNVMLVVVCGEKTDLLDVPSELRPVFIGLAPKFDAPTLVHAMALGEQTLRSLKSTTMARPLLDALMVRLALSGQFSAIKDLLRGGGAEAAGEKKNIPSGPSPRPSMMPAEPVAPPVTPVAAMPAPANPLPMAPSGGRPRIAPAHTPVRPPVETPLTVPLGNAPVSHEEAPPMAPPAVETMPPAPAPIAEDGSVTPPSEEAPDAAPGIDTSNLPEIWTAASQWLSANKANSINMMLGTVAKVLACDAAAGEVRLALPSRLQSYAGDKVRAKIAEALGAVIGRSVRLAVEWVESAPPRPALGGNPAGATASRPMAAPAPAPVRVPPQVEQAVRDHPMVQRLVEKLNGNVTLIELLQPESENAS